MKPLISISLNFILQDGIEEVKQHKWFRGVDWDAVLMRKVTVSLYH